MDQGLPFFIPCFVSKDTVLRAPYFLKRSFAILLVHWVLSICDFRNVFPKNDKKSKELAQNSLEIYSLSTNTYRTLNYVTFILFFSDQNVRMW